MEGITDGYKMRAEEEPRLEDEGMNHENGIMLLNFIADFWDLKVKLGGWGTLYCHHPR